MISVVRQNNGGKGADISVRMFRESTQDLPYPIQLRHKCQRPHNFELNHLHED